MIATKATLSGKTLTIEAPQIVNGLQTSSELYKYMSSSNNPSDQRNILIRVIVPNESVSRDRIIKATNSQTSIPQASLRATDPIHQDIEDYLKSHGIYYDRRKNYYKNEGRPINQIISISYLAQSVMSIVLKKPDDARARPSTLMKNDEDYNRIFDPNYPVTLYLQCIRIMKRIEDFLRNSPISSKDVNNIKFHLAMFSTMLTLNSPEVKPAKLGSLPLASFDDDFLQQCLQEVLKVYQDMGGDDQTAKGSDFAAKLIERLSQMIYHGRLTAYEHQST